MIREEEEEGKVRTGEKEAVQPDKQLAKNIQEKRNTTQKKRDTKIKPTVGTRCFT